jgi:DNA-binding XRE family transcriptional regulator
MVDRIKQVMEHYEETPASFAEKIGVNRSNLTHVFSGRNQPSLDFAKKVLVAFPEVSTEWLIMGVGKMIKDPEEMVPVKKTFVQTDLFDTVDESETVVPTVNEVGIMATDNDALQSSVEIPLENVKQEEQESSSLEMVQEADNKGFEHENMPRITAPESNIQNLSVPQPGKNDSQRVEQEVAKEVVKPEPQVQVQPRNQTQTPKEKKIEKIIFFYDDDSFKVYHP